MLMVADVGEGGVSDLLMSAKKKSYINLARICTKSCLEMYSNITVGFSITSVFLTTFFEIEAIQMHKNCLLLHLMNFKNIDCWWTKGC